MKISVIVTTYNQPHALKKVLDSLYMQTRLPDEILVADDGSGNVTRNVLTQFENISGPAFFHVWQKDLGFRAALVRNRAVLAARGDYLVLLDGDCIPDCRFVADHLALAEPGFFFQGKRVLVEQKASRSFDVHDTASLFRLISHAVHGRISNAHHILRMPFFPCFRSCKLSGIRSCNMGFYRQDALSVNGFNLDFEGWGREDSEFAARLFKMGLKKKEHPFRAICYHLWHSESPRIFLERNDALLTKTLASEAYACEHGLNSLKPCNKLSGINSSREGGHDSA